MGQWPIYEFITKSQGKKGVKQNSLERVKRMYNTITKLTSADLSVGHYDRVATMWANYYCELELTLEQPNKVRKTSQSLHSAGVRAIGRSGVIE